MSIEFSKDVLIMGSPADVAGIMFDPTRDHEWMTAVTSSVPQSVGISIGAEVKPHEKLVLMAEYAFNGSGAERPNGYAQVLSSARVLRGEVFGAGRHQAALAASFLASDLLTAQLSVLGNLTDPSALLIPSFEYSFTQSVLVRAGAYVPLGRPPDPRVYDGLTATDVLTQSEAYRTASATRGLRSDYGSSSFGAFLQLGVYVP